MERGDGAISATGAPLWHLHGPAGPMAGAEGIEVPLGPDGLEPEAALRALAGRGITRVLCEGGGRLAAALLRADLVDRLAVHQAGLVLGSDGRAAVGPLGLDRLALAPRFRLARTQAAGGDLVQDWVRDRAAG